MNRPSLARQIDRCVILLRSCATADESFAVCTLASRLIGQTVDDESITDPVVWEAVGDLYDALVSAKHMARTAIVEAAANSAIREAVRGRRFLDGMDQRMEGIHA